MSKKVWLLTIIVIVMFALLTAMVVVQGFKEGFGSFLSTSVVPPISNAIGSFTKAVVLSPFWQSWGWIVLIGGGLVVGLGIYHYYSKGVWSVRRFMANRTAKDIGATGVTNIPSTPTTVTPTTRPTTQTPTSEPPLEVPTELTEETKT